MSNAAQVKARRDSEDKLAQSLGYKSLSDLKRAWVMGYIKIPKCPRKWAEFRDARNPSRLPRKSEE